MMPLNQRVEPSEFAQDREQPPAQIAVGPAQVPVPDGTLAAILDEIVGGVARTRLPGTVLRRPGALS